MGLFNKLRSAFIIASFAMTTAAQAATINIPDAFLAAYLQGAGNLGTATVKCALIDYASYSRTTDVYLTDVTQVAGTGYVAGGQTATSVVVAADTTNHWTTITITPAVWSGSTTISATGAVCYDSTNSNRIIAVDSFGSTVSSSGGTYTVGPITLKFTHF